MKVVFFFVIHLHLGVKSFYTYVTIQSSLLQMATGLCLVCNSKRNNRTIEYQLKLLLKLFKRISIDILLFTVSQVNSKFPAHSLLAPLPLQFQINVIFLFSLYKSRPDRTRHPCSVIYSITFYALKSLVDVVKLRSVK